MNINRETIAILRKMNRKNGGGLTNGSARKIAEDFHLKTYTPRYSPHTPPPRYLLNWGNTMEICWPMPSNLRILNNPDSVRIAVDKLACLSLLSYHCIPCLKFTDDIDRAKLWARVDGKVFCRTLSRSTKGKGIVIAETRDEVVPAPLYTKWYNKNREYRVHVFDGEVIDIQIKKKRSKASLEELNIEVNPDIRNLDGGYVFCRENIRRNLKMEEACIFAVSKLELDFGAVDVLGYVEDNVLVDFVLCEVNTAPALEGTTYESYINAISKLLDDHNRLSEEFINMVENN